MVSRSPGEIAPDSPHMMPQKSILFNDLPFLTEG
jgi:hypothetical protein